MFIDGRQLNCMELSRSSFKVNEQYTGPPRKQILGSGSKLLL
jgi:hypothetical protein